MSTAAPIDRSGISPLQPEASLSTGPSAQPGLTRLVEQNAIRVGGESWHRAVLSDIEARLAGDPEFPCLFSKNAFQKGLLRFIFVDSIEADGIEHLAAGLAEYVELSRNWNRSLNTAYPLLVAFSRDAANESTVEGYHSLGWKVLQALHGRDPAPWPVSVGKDANEPSWSMSFSGMPIFCNMSNPAHQLRRSRNLGQHLVLVINPRERFDIVAGDTPAGRKVRANIRSRIDRYDGAPHAPQLGSYGMGGTEWWQYGLLDENLERKDRCPFQFIGRPAD